MVSRTSWRCLKTPVSVTTLINGDGCPVLMPLNSWNCLQVSLKIWSHSKYGHQFGSHVESHDITVVWISWCLGWLGEFQLLFSHLVSWVMKERHTDFNHFVIKRRQSEFHLVYWVKPADISTVPASADSPSLLKSFVLKSSMYSGSHWNAHNVASCGQSHQRKRCAMNIHNNRGASSICTKAAHATYLCLFTVLQFALGKSGSKKVHYEHIFITWTLQSRRFLPSEISARALCSRRREYLHRWKTNFANTLVL